MTSRFDPKAQDRAIRRWKRGMFGFASSSTGSILGFAYVLDTPADDPAFLLGAACVMAFGLGVLVSLYYIVVGSVDMDIQGEHRDRSHRVASSRR